MKDTPFRNEFALRSTQGRGVDSFRNEFALRSTQGRGVDSFRNEFALRSTQGRGVDSFRNEFALRSTRGSQRPIRAASFELAPSCFVGCQRARHQVSAS